VLGVGRGRIWPASSNRVGFSRCAADPGAATLAPQEEPRYVVRWRAAWVFLHVIDLSNGQPVNANPTDRYKALELASALERGVASSAARMGVRDTTGPPFPTGRSRSAERSARYRDASAPRLMQHEI